MTLFRFVPPWNSVRHQCGAKFQSVVNHCSPIVTWAHVTTESKNIQNMYILPVCNWHVSLAASFSLPTYPVINSRKSLRCLCARARHHNRSSSELFPLHAVSWQHVWRPLRLAGRGGLVSVGRKRNIWDDVQTVQHVQIIPARGGGGHSCDNAQQPTRGTGAARARWSISDEPCCRLELVHPGSSGGFLRVNLLPRIWATPTWWRGRGLDLTERRASCCSLGAGPQYSAVTVCERNLPGASGDECPLHAFVSSPTFPGRTERWAAVKCLSDDFSLCFSHPVAHCVCLLLKPGPLEATLLLFAWRQSHASCWVFFMSCFWTENTWNRRLRIPHCLTEQRAQLSQSARGHWLSVEGWGYILSIYAQNGCIFSWWHEGERWKDDWPVVHNL